MKLILRGTEVRINLNILIMPLLMLIAGFFREYAAAFFSMLLHETGHIITAAVCGIRTDIIYISMLGFSAAIQDGSCHKRNLLFIYAAGPALNLFIFIAALIAERVLPGCQKFCRLISVSNLFLALFNLLPVLPLDGGRLVVEILAGGIGGLTAAKIVRSFAWIVSAAMILTGVYQLFITSFNVSLIMIGLYIMMISKTGRMEVALMSIRQMIYRRARVIKRGIYPARDIVVMKGMKLRESLKNMDFDRFHIVHVLDDGMHIIGTFTENEIMDALTEECDEMTFGQFVDQRIADDVEVQT